MTSANGPDDARAFWERRARRVTRRVAVAWWLSALLPAVVALAASFAAILLVARQHDVPPAPLWAGLAVAVACAAAVAWRSTRARRFSTADALVRLDLVGGLDARLAAAPNLGTWPAPRPQADDGLRWRVVALAGPAVGAALLLAAAALVPVTRASAPPGEVVEPIAWSEVESRLAELERAEVFDPEALEAFRAAVAELRAQPPRDWYGHASLEAADHLRERLSGALGAMGPDLARAERAVGTLAELSGTERSQALARAAEEAHAAVPGLEQGAVPLRREMLGQMRGLDYRSLSKKDLQALGRALSRGRSAAERRGGKEGAGTKPCPGGGPGTGPCDEPGGKDPGSGGVTRGPGPAPLTLGAGDGLAVPTAIEPLPRGDLGHAALGDVVRQEVLVPETKRGATGTPAGRVAATGSGGDTVWRDRVTPAERKFLQRYFR